MTTLAHEFENTAEVDVEPSVLDRKEALQRVMDDVDLLRTVFEIFFEDYPEQLRRIEEAVEANDGTTLQFSAHALKSGLGNRPHIRRTDVPTDWNKWGPNSRCREQRSL